MSRYRAPNKWPKKRVRLLGPCEVTRHALDAYRTRIGEKAERELLEREFETARLIARKPTGECVYSADGCRLIVHQPARRRPVVLTVVPEEEPLRRRRAAAEAGGNGGSARTRPQSDEEGQRR